MPGPSRSRVSPPESSPVRTVQPPLPFMGNLVGIPTPGGVSSERIQEDQQHEAGAVFNFESNWGIVAREERLVSTKIYRKGDAEFAGLWDFLLAWEKQVLAKPRDDSLRSMGIKEEVLQRPEAFLWDLFLYADELREAFAWLLVGKLRLVKDKLAVLRRSVDNIRELLGPQLFDALTPIVRFEYSPYEAGLTVQFRHETWSFGFSLRRPLEATLDHPAEGSQLKFSFATRERKFCWEYRRESAYGNSDLGENIRKVDVPCSTERS